MAAADATSRFLRPFPYFLWGIILRRVKRLTRRRANDDGGASFFGEMMWLSSSSPPTIPPLCAARLIAHGSSWHRAKIKTLAKIIFYFVPLFGLSRQKSAKNFVEEARTDTRYVWSVTLVLQKNPTTMPCTQNRSETPRCAKLIRQTTVVGGVAPYHCLAAAAAATWPQPQPQ